jgi:crotonobetainyl-CoA:carnitine CoA-transferase CaiB-like acyl-CoA transferase
MVMGPYCTQIMADMGADVIKVEPPEGDNTRYISVGPAPGMSGVYINVNRGKRAIVLDLRTDEGKEALRALVATADVFIHSMRSKAIVKLGFGYDDVAAINPSIVYTNCYGYGRRGPNRDLPAYDDTIQAECGIPAVQELLTGEANYVGTIMADKVAGLTALYATTMALFHRERTGEGQEVEVSMFETMASFMLVEHANGAMFDPPLGPAVYPRTVAPNRRPYRRADLQRQALERVRQRRQAAVGDRGVRDPGNARERHRHRLRAGRRDVVGAHDRRVDGAVPGAADSRRSDQHSRRAVRPSPSERSRPVRNRRNTSRTGENAWCADVVLAYSRPDCGRDP